jgi:hypothetical protein
MLVKPNLARFTLLLAASGNFVAGEKRAEVCKGTIRRPRI